MKLSRDKINHISSLIVNDFENREELDYKMDLNDVRLEITRVMTEELKLDENADNEARKIIASGHHVSKTLRRMPQKAGYWIHSFPTLNSDLLISL
jgi:hypothetical protein